MKMQELRSTKRPPAHQISKSKTIDKDAAKASAMRAAKLHIRENVREDWTWPPPDLEIPYTRCSSIETQWRERESDSSPCPSPSLESHGPSTATDPYKFENPESLLDVKSRRKRKRHLALQEEKDYNAGLRTYLDRRDAWTGAWTGTTSVPPSPLAGVDESESSDSVAAASGSDDSDLPSPLTSISHLSTTCNVGCTASQPHPESPMDLDPVTSIPSTLVPLPPPLLPLSNPARAPISPSAYPTIYSKIVVQGVKPTLPVNLKDVVCAVVDGWKKDGEWPPKDSEGRVYQGKQAGSIGGINPIGDGVGKALAKKGVERVKRALGMDKESVNEDG